MTSTFVFLQTNYPELYTISELAEKLIYIDPSSSLAKARLFSEKIVELIWQFEELEESEDTQIKKINILYNEDYIPEILRDILHAIRKSGNRAAHTGSGNETEALFIIKKTFRLAKWFYETYENISLGDIIYQPVRKPEHEEIEALNQQLDILSKELIDYKEKIALLNQSTEIKNERKKRSEAIARNITLNEAETRVMLIDPLLRKAGWECDSNVLNFKYHKTLPQKGRNMAIAEWKCGNTWADYALFVGTTLYGIVEAKRYATDISTNLHQSKIYASNIIEENEATLLGEWNGYKVPFLFSTNGRDFLEQIRTKSGVWFLDVRNAHNQSHPLRAWYSPNGLVELYNRDIEELNDKLINSEIDYLTDTSGLNLRYYQIDAIKAVEDKIINDQEEKRSLLVMATGTGKTRTAIGLAYRLVKSNRFRRILFMTDRRLLATQAFDGFKDNKIEELNTFAGIYQIEGLDKALPDSDTRLHFATVQSMMKRLFYSDEDFVLPIDAYDCIIVDEAHRGYNLDREMDNEDISFRNQNDYVSQYKRVIEYFDAYVIGLTATPALHTTQIFGIPVHSYSYREAVIDGYLVDHEPPFIIKTKQSEEGLLWERGEKPKGYNPETNKIEELAELEDELHVEIDQFNKTVITPEFNRTVIKELVKYLDPESDGKTLIFAARDPHADMIVDMLYEEFAAINIDVHHDAIKKITGSAYKPDELTKLFKNEKYPNIVVTVDLLSTGIDVPKITNIVFLRRTNSRIYFEQMLGRATRLCTDIGKEYFRIFDTVRVYEALQEFTQMQTVSNPQYTFVQLRNEFESIQTEERKTRQVQQIIAKLQRRCKNIEGDQLDQFKRLSGGETPGDFIHSLREMSSGEAEQKLKGIDELWNFLDERIYKPKIQLISEHEDELISVERGYGNATKPEDYINSFKEFITENRNSIMAINIICTKPSELTRESLKELKLVLDQKGYSETKLNTAWRYAKNIDIVADIIAYIRTLALDTALVTPEERVKNAIQKVKSLHPWNARQLSWINRFEKQLIAEKILRKEDLNKPPFIGDGGYEKINKLFDNELDKIIEVINENLFVA